MSESLCNDGRIWVPVTLGDERAPGDIPETEGWLMRVQGSGGEDTLGVDVGFSGGAASAEEAAMHIIRDDQDEDDDF